VSTTEVQDLSRPANDPGFARALNIKGGEIVYEPVAEAYAQDAPIAAW
jgi:hypothetical protein